METEFEGMPIGFIPFVTFFVFGIGGALAPAPTGLHVVSTTDTTITLAWTGTSSRYKVYVDGVQVAVVPGQQYTFTGLVSATGYQLGVRSGGKNSSFVVIEASTSGTPTPPPPPPPPPAGGAPIGTTIFSAGEGITDWDLNSLGGLYNSGTWTATMDNAHVHSGSYALKATITTPDASGSSGVRAFRWGELHSNRTLILRAWYYIPSAFVLTADPNTGQFALLMEVKSKNQDGSRTDPVWSTRFENIGGVLKPYVNWGGGGYQVAGPQSGNSVSSKQYRQAQPTIPIGQWFKLTYLITQSSVYSGAVTIWLDDTQIFSMSSVNTAYVVTGFNSWQTNNHFAATLYSDGLTPNPSSIWIDDYVEALP